MAELFLSDDLASRSHDVCDCCEQVFLEEDRDRHSCWRPGLTGMCLEDEVHERAALAAREGLRLYVLDVAPDVSSALGRELGARLRFVGTGGTNARLTLGGEGQPDELLDAYMEIGIRLDLFTGPCVVRTRDIPAGWARGHSWDVRAADPRRGGRSTMDDASRILRDLWRPRPGMMVPGGLPAPSSLRTKRRPWER